MNTLTKDQKERFDEISSIVKSISDFADIYDYGEITLILEEVKDKWIALAVKHERDRIVKALDEEIVRVKKYYDYPCGGMDRYVSGLEFAKQIIERSDKYATK